MKVVPRPASPVCRAFNVSRPREPALPKLIGGEFVLLCAPDQLDEHLSRIEDPLPHLRQRHLPCG